MIKRFISRIKKNTRGQSFAELLIVTLVLALLLAGVVEFGFLLNQYLHVLDSSREAARFSSSSDPIADNGTSIELFYIFTAIEAMRVMDPIELEGNRGDDIVISVMSVDGTNIARFPDNDGWSLCGHYNGTVLRENMLAYLGVGKYNDFLTNWSSCVEHASGKLTNDVRDMLNPVAPSTGILIVEIFYNYEQMLKLPVFTNSIYSVIPDPIPISVYTVMPISAAEPTPTPRP
jgi:hypothetical protein